MNHISGIRELAFGYRHMFIDVYGVLHDGGEAFPGAANALLEARRRGIRVVIVTNSAGRVGAVKARLAEAGIGSDGYDHIVSSGELTWRHLEQASAGAATPLRLRIVQENAWPAWVAELSSPLVDHVGEADGFVAAGMPFRTEAEFMESGFEAELGAACELGLPMVVADSDETYPSHGRIRLGPGWLARRFAKLGGETIEFGKPHAPVYDEALRLAGDPDPSSVLMIGDNLLTDIAGAKAAGIDSLLALQHGVHAGQPIEAIMAQAADNGMVPTWSIQELRW